MSFPSTVVSELITGLKAFSIYVIAGFVVKNATDFEYVVNNSDMFDDMTQRFTYATYPDYSPYSSYTGLAAALHM